MNINASVGISNFTSKDPEEIILEMYRLRQRILLGENIEMPQVTIMLWPEGKQVTGFVLDINNEKNDKSVAIQLGSYQSTGDVLYAYLGAIRGVIVHDIERYENLLTEITSESHMNKTPTTTKLDVRKRLDSEAKSLSEKTATNVTYSWQGDLPEGQMPLFVIVNLITDVTMCLKELMLTDLGKQAVAAGINKVTFIRSNKEFSVSLANKELIVTGEFDKSFTTSQRRWQLKDKLEALL